MEGSSGDEQGQPPEIIIDQSQMAGVWANFACVSHSPYEFTLDFVRLDFEQGSGVVVAAGVRLSALHHSAHRGLVR